MADPVAPRAARFRPRSSATRKGFWYRFGPSDGSSTLLIAVYGLMTLVLGIVILVWPTETPFVLAIVIGVQLLVTGVVQVVRALGGEGAAGGTRAILGVLGALAFLAGMLCLRASMWTLPAVALVIGSWWIVSGVLLLVGGVTGGDRTWTWAVVVGPLTFAAGAVVLLQPRLSLPTLIVIVGFWFLVQGVLTIVLGIGAPGPASPGSARAGPTRADSGEGTDWKSRP